MTLIAARYEPGAGSLWLSLNFGQLTTYVKILYRNCTIIKLHVKYVCVKIPVRVSICVCLVYVTSLN